MDGMIAPSVAEFSTEGLPHLPREALDRSRLLARAVGASMRAERIKVRGLGLLSVAAEWVAVTLGASRTKRATALLVLVRNGVGGRLLSTPPLRWGRCGPFSGYLRPSYCAPDAVERGMLGAIIAARLPALAPGTSLSLDLRPVHLFPGRDPRPQPTHAGTLRHDGLARPRWLARRLRRSDPRGRSAADHATGGRTGPNDAGARGPAVYGRWRRVGF